MHGPDPPGDILPPDGLRQVVDHVRAGPACIEIDPRIG
jgi:hypothetical protein